MPKTSMPDFQAHLSRSGFDMSQSLAFTASTGMILPVYSDLLNSGEKVYITSDLFARTQPLVTAAMSDVDVYLDWFFVPMTMLLTTWGQIRWQTNDFISSSVMSPTIDGSTSFSSLFSLDKFPVLSIKDTVQIDSTDSVNESSVFSITPMNTYKTSDSEASVSYIPLSFNEVYGDGISYPQFEVFYKSEFRMLDLLGYNPLTIFAKDSTTTGLGRYSYSPNVFPWRALVYQCIYQNYYRNDDYELRDVASYNWDCWFTNGSNSPVNLSSLSDHVNPRNPFILRYSDYRKDYFTSVRPSPIASSLNSLPFPMSWPDVPTSGSTSNSTLFNLLQSVNNYLAGNVSQSGQFIMPSGRGGTNSIPPSKALNSNALMGGDVTQVGVTTDTPSTGNLRSMFAIEKLLRITGRAAKDYDSQTLAHFGFKVPHDVKHQLTHLHTSHGTLHIGEVISTSDTVNGTTGTALGEIAGKGYISIHDNKSIKFTAPVDGAIMCTFRAIPRLRVIAGFDKQNSITDRLSLYIPEFDKLGAQPLYLYESSFLQNGSQTNALLSSSFGWQNRYEQYKRKYDRASFVFTSFLGSEFRSQVNQYSAWISSYSPFGGMGNFGLGLNPTSAPWNQPHTIGMYLKCPPTALNSIMAVPYQHVISSYQNFYQNPAQEYYTDPFICDFRANVKKVSTMSPTGEPDMISL